MATVAISNAVPNLFQAVLFPPVAVFLKDGAAANFWLYIVLPLVGFWAIGMEHALIVVP